MVKDVHYSFWFDSNLYKYLNNQIEFARITKTFAEVHSEYSTRMLMGPKFRSHMCHLPADFTFNQPYLVTTTPLLPATDWLSVKITPTLIRIVTITKQRPWYYSLTMYKPWWFLDWKKYTQQIKNQTNVNMYSTTVIAKIKGMPRSLFYVIPRFVTMDYEKWYTSLLLTQCGEICAFEAQNQVSCM